jgi:hypothetical protein
MKAIPIGILIAAFTLGATASAQAKPKQTANQATASAKAKPKQTANQATASTKAKPKQAVNQKTVHLNKALAAIATTVQSTNPPARTVDRDQGDDHANFRAILRVCSKDTPAARRSAICPVSVSPN